jgi:hypothetical protein
LARPANTIVSANSFALAESLASHARQRRLRRARDQNSRSTKVRVKTNADARIFCWNRLKDKDRKNLKRTESFRELVGNCALEISDSRGE